MDSEIRDLARYEGPVGYVRLAWLKTVSLASVDGFFHTLLPVAANVASLQLLYRFEVKVVSPSSYSSVLERFSFQLLESLGEFDSWAQKDAIERIRGRYGLVQARLRLVRGYRLFCACQGTALAGFLWLAPSTSLEAGYKIKSNEAYLIDGWTFSEFRGLGILAKLISFIAHELHNIDPGVNTLVSHAVVWNRRSISGQRKAGMRISSLELSLRALGFHRKLRIRSYHDNNQRVRS